MKLPNGYGSVHKLSGKRRNPYRARKTSGFVVDDCGKAKQEYITIGYFPSRQAALQALADYNANPYDIKTDSITFSEVYEKWSDEHFNTIVPSAVRTWKSAYNHCLPLYNMRMKDIRVNHLEQTIVKASVGDATKSRMKSLFNLMYAYCLRHEIVDKNYASLCNSIKKPKSEIARIPFSDSEIKILWENLQFPFVDMLLIGIYSGWRPQELAILKITDVNLDNMTFVGGLKTDAGRNRIVPIHSKILNLIKTNYENALSMKSNYLFNDEAGQQGTVLTYDKYRGRFNKIMLKFKMSHKPHDARHTFITSAKKYSVDEYCLKLMVGHAIEDITEKVYTHRTIEQLKKEIEKIE